MSTDGNACTTALLDHNYYVQWAKDYGVQINGVAPAATPGTGNGLVATRPIKTGEKLVRVPASALLSIESVPDTLRTQLKGGTVHGLLAAFLAQGKGTQHYAPWFRTFPTEADICGSMPLMWSLGDSNKIFPRAIAGDWSYVRGITKRSDGLLAKQKAKLMKDFAHVRSSVPNLSFESYRYHWLLVNTRSFYYDLLPGKKPKSRYDCMVLCPFADYFNHADHGCNVTYSEDGFNITADREYDEGVETFISYGSHTNDFLLTEYGFILDENKWDNLPVDDLIYDVTNDAFPRSLLEQSGYLGAYTLSKDGVCFRTEVAVRAYTMPPKRWSKYVEGILNDGYADEKVANGEIETRILQPYYEEASMVLEHLEKCAEVPDPIKAVLFRRWRHIIEIIETARAVVSPRKLGPV